ncbi:sigma-54 dependent transcriptional regulator [uncultured Ralstonia sp.]|mgnify:CR=1 FL=1|jgi:DNA-binding NtrC family response regulator|uniref:sigma-54 dependent transcriptional regulator n=1 Tax=Ralstonia sp. TaxID=54061 RepID=UPI0025EC13FE|nr:sigma-54 dependent transcriptional regulator [uncultured Ralstonia sp.]
MNAYVNRPLLYVSLHHDAMLCRYLTQQGWRLIFATSRRELEALDLDDEPALSGLMDLTCGYSDAELEELEPWLASRNIGWIGMVCSGDVLTDPMRKLLGLYFVDYYNVPCDNAELARALGHAVGMASLRPAATPARDALRPDGMIGNCPAMQALFRGIEKVSKWDTPVLISGESGTGKELAAQAIHRASRRADRPFIAVNCAAIPPTLLMSELFGYERGAFTGATRRKLGRIELAQGGTLFLDEIGDMPLESQTSLLRFLETGCIERLGGTESVAVDVRVISATHVDLEAAVMAERFRGDLYHRLCVLRVKQPALRERETDIALLAEHILNAIRSHSPEHIKGFSPAAVRALNQHDWPGNVRELINRIRQAAAMCEDGILKPRDLDLQPPPEPARPLTLAEVREAAERGAVKEALQRHHERLIDVAEELGISRVTLFRMMREYKLQIRKSEMGMVCVQG